MDKNIEIKNLIKNSLSPETNAFVSVEETTAYIEITSYNQGADIPKVWELIPKIDLMLMDITDSDVTSVTANFNANLYDPSGEEFFRFQIYFLLDN